jgi:hypothetical protein
MDLTTLTAGSYAPSPGWDAVIVQVPTATARRVDLLIEHAGDIVAKVIE